MPSGTGKTRKAGAGSLIFSLLYVLAFPVLLLWLSGNWLWVEGLVFSGWFIAMCYPLIVWLFIKNPSLFLERVKPNTANQKPWDKVFVSLLVLLFISWFAIMPIDASRFQWTQNFPEWLKIVGGILLLPSAFLFIKAYIDNPYLSGVVRIQEDRGHEVISTGVYGFVRHPMYLAGMLLFIGAPLLMGSLYGLVFTIVFITGLVYRIFGEEKMLETELKGYTDYKNKIRFRLFPYIW